MKIIRVLAILLLFGYGAKAQQDTVYVNEWQLADSVFGQLTTKVSTGLLFNRTFLDSTNSFALNTNGETSFNSKADYYYQLMYELKLMSLDTSATPSSIELFNSASIFVGEHEFKDERQVYPIGIIDVEYEILDVDYGLANGTLNLVNNSYIDVSTSNDAYSIARSTLIAPMFDLMSNDNNMALIFREQDFYSNHKNISDVSQLEIYYDSIWISLNFDEEFIYTPKNDSIQRFNFRVVYNNGDTLYNNAIINTPLLAKINTKAHQDKLCHDEYTFQDAVGNNLKACFIPSCSNKNVINPYPKKTYILVAGYRPPIFGQKFKRTWELYNDFHGNLLSQLIDNDYDIYLVKFNIQWKPYQHGMIESSELFIQFLEYINYTKSDEYNENVIQGSSMGVDIVRLSLLKMEQKHFSDNTYPHHHSRLFISHDANYYGGNIPLAYQYQIYSAFKQPASGLGTGIPGTLFLKLFLYATMEQKTVKELLTYHAKATHVDLFSNNNENYFLSPTYHPDRQNYLNALSTVDNGEHFVALPSSTRNISISLGKISGTNNLSNTTSVSFKASGTYWWDVNLGLLKLQLRAATPSPTWHERLFRRKRIGISFLPWSLSMDHIVNVKGMQAIDNASGSYLNSFGNIISVADWAYFTLGNLFNGKNHFTHKPVVTALAINKNLWPSDGSMTLNIQSLGLMYNNYADLNANLPTQSEHFGYPNLGRPIDHFNITPFEAIYVDNKIDPHINLEESDATDKLVLTDFIKNEVEPWYLGLQNESVGSQARANYIYKVRRRAKYSIVIGNLVTPKTDPGHYNVNPNGQLLLEAGESIDVLPGTTFLHGCEADLSIFYNPCVGVGGRIANSSSNPSDQTTIKKKRKTQLLTKKEYIEQSEIRIFPNPSNGSFTIASMQDIPIDYFEIYDLSSNLVLKQKNVNRARYQCKQCLHRGVYIIHIYLDGIVKQQKLIVP